MREEALWATRNTALCVCMLPSLMHPATTITHAPSYYHHSCTQLLPSLMHPVITDKHDESAGYHGYLVPHQNDWQWLKVLLATVFGASLLLQNRWEDCQYVVRLGGTSAK